MEVGHVTDDTFEQEVVSAETPVLVDFWAEWCGPCKQIAPLLDEVAAEMADSIRVVKINIDENPNSPARYGVRGIPTLLLFRNGEIANTKVGAATKPKLVSWIKETLA